LRRTLTACQGLLAAVLLIWQQYNERVITEMGMAWDTGVPLWPYETPWIVFTIVNAPAALAGLAISNLAGLEAFGERLPVYRTTAILLWVSVGVLIDRGVHRCHIRVEPWLLGAVAGAGLVCFCLGLASISSGVHWWSSYGAWSTSSILTFARIVAIVPWCALILAVSVRIVYLSLRVRQDLE
jgi:hypothetical protein